jgi:hypothetical protein
MTRYNYIKLNNHFFVTDSRSMYLNALNHHGQPANALDPTEAKYFQLTQDEARALADHLNQ